MPQDETPALPKSVRIAGILIAIGIIIGAIALDLPRIVRITRLHLGASSASALIAGASSANLTDRAAAIAAIEKIDTALTPEQARALCYLIADGNAKNRAAAIAIADNPARVTPATLAQAAAAIASQGDTGHSAALHTFAHIGPKTAADVTLCVDTLKQGDARHRHQAALALRAVDPTNPDAVSAIATGMKGSNPYVRLQLAGALAELGPALTPHIRPLIAQGKNETSEVRRQLVRAFHQAPPEICDDLALAWKNLSDSDAEYRDDLARAIQNHGTAAAGVADTILPFLTSGSDRAWSAAEILSSIAPQRLDTAIAPTLQDRSAQRRAFAVKVYLLIPDLAKRRLNALRAALKDESADVRRQALDTLTSIDPDHGDDYLKALADDPDPAIRQAIKDIRSGGM